MISNVDDSYSFHQLCFNFVSYKIIELQIRGHVRDYSKIIFPISQQKHML